MLRVNFHTEPAALAHTEPFAGWVNALAWFSRGGEDLPHVGSAIASTEAEAQRLAEADLRRIARRHGMR